MSLLATTLRRTGRRFVSSLPALFGDPAYRETMAEIVVSTSTLSSPALLAGGFGPVGPNCYGIGYGIDAERARVAVSSYEGRDGARFAELVGEAYVDMRDLVAGGDDEE